MAAYDILLSKGQLICVEHTAMELRLLNTVLEE